MATLVPSDIDHTVFLNRALKDPSENLPEADEKEITEKIKAEEKAAEIIKEIVDEDLLHDNSTGSRISTYVGDGKKNKILQQSEYQVDKEAKRKQTRIEDDIKRLKDKKKSIQDGMDAAEEVVKEKEKEVSHAAISIEREARTASSYWKALSNLRRNKKGGRKAGAGSKKTKKSKKLSGE